MNFDDSSHKLRWMLSPTQLGKRREECHARAVLRGQQANSGSSSVPSISPEEELLLLRYYQAQLVAICAKLHMPTRVQCAALTYFKRFYLSYSTMEFDPRNIMLTCIYTASKVEEHYISAEDFCKQLEQKPSAVLRNETALLQGLGFDLIVHSPYKALAGLFQELTRLCAERPSALDASLISSLEPATRSRARGSATSAVDALMLSDAPLLHPPGQLALAALKSGFRACNLNFSSFLLCAIKNAVQHMKVDSSHVEARLRELQRNLDDIDQLGMAGTRKVSTQDASAVDRKLREWRNAAKAT